MIIEYGHVYIADIDAGNIDFVGIQKSIDLAQGVRSSGDLLLVLIDDKDYELSDDQKKSYVSKVIDLYTLMGLRPDAIHFEKRFSDQAVEFIEQLPSENIKIESFRKQKKKVTFLKNEGRLIPLMSEAGSAVSFSCQLLSSLWRQHKEVLALGLDKSRTLTILDKKFQQVEEDVAYLNGLLPSSTAFKHDYLWY